MVLNNEIDLASAQVYSSITKTIAQAKNIERAAQAMKKQELDITI